MSNLQPNSNNFYHTIIKPTGAQCNLDCTYCFYLHKEDLLAQPKNPRMSLEVLEEHIRQYIESQTGPEVIFTWQGGEPTLIGLDFYKKAVELQQKYKRPYQRVENDLQTNGVLLDDEWCNFLKQHNFLVGISIDGPEAFHDAYRKAKGGQNSFKKVMSAIELLRKYKITFNALCVVNDVNSKAPIETYRFLADIVRPRIIQFIPVVEPIDFKSNAPSLEGDVNWPKLGEPRAKPKNENSVVTDWSVDPDDWGNFLNTIWDEWIEKDFGKTFIDQFESIVSIMYGKGSQMCVTSPKCGKGLAIEHDGSLYSCDHYVYEDYKLGNILEINEGELAFSKPQEKFGSDKYDSLTDFCKSCDYIQYCWGECPKNRFISAPNGQKGLNYLCSGLKAFYKKAHSNRQIIFNKVGRI